VELEVINSLTQLESRGVFKQKNMMDLGELLNPEGKQDLLEDISEESVFEAVQLMNDSGQETDMHCEDQVTVEGPSRKEALVASLTLQKYIAGINKPYAHQLEAQLTGFGCEIRLDQAKSMQETYITDYFTQK
jgi:hypothetical protein